MKTKSPSPDKRRSAAVFLALICITALCGCATNPNLAARREAASITDPVRLKTILMDDSPGNYWRRAGALDVMQDQAALKDLCLMPSTKKNSTLYIPALLKCNQSTVYAIAMAADYEVASTAVDFLTDVDLLADFAIQRPKCHHETERQVTVHVTSGLGGQIDDMLNNVPNASVTLPDGRVLTNKVTVKEKTYDNALNLKAVECITYWHHYQYTDDPDDWGYRALKLTPDKWRQLLERIAASAADEEVRAAARKALVTISPEALKKIDRKGYLKY